MKKLLKIFLVVFVVSVLLGAFAACNPDCKGDHQYGEWHQTTATCTEGGIAGYYQCTVCEKYFDADHNEIAKESLNIEALGHTFTSADFIEEVGATCLGNGTKAHFHCERCGKNFAADGTTELTDLAITGGTHAFGAWVDEVPATCKEAGTKGHKDCTLCGKHFDADGNEITDLTIAITSTHTLGEWIAEVPANCKEAGTKGHKDCTVCGKHFDADGNEIADLTIAVTNEHTFGEWINEVPSNCSDTGTKAHKDCTVCGKHFDAEGNEMADLTIPVAGTHVFGTWVDEVPASCTTNGTKGHKVCSACGYNFDAEGNKLESLVIPAAHTLTKVEGTPATCTEAGELLHWHCSVCNKNFDANNQELTNLVIAAKGHTFGAWIAEVPASCTTAGAKGHKDCSVCQKHFDNDGNEIADLTIAAKGHTWDSDEIHAEKPATCAAAGEKAHWHCSVCNKNFDSDKETVLTDLAIAKLAHTFGEWINEVPATCEVAGTKAHKDCTACGKHFDADGKELEDIAIKALGHNCAENVCQREGCGKTLTAQEIVDALYALANDESLPGTYKLTGVITKITSAWDATYKNITVTISVCGKDVVCYRMKSGEGQDASTLAVGHEITVTGTLIYTYGNREFNTGCLLVDVAIPTYTLTVPKVEHATISDLDESYQSGSTVSFKVTADEGYKVEFVKINGSVVLADEDGNYSFTIISDTEIAVSVVDESKATAQNVILKYTGTSTGNMEKDSNNAATVNLDAALFTVTSNAAGAKNNLYIGLNKDGGIRLYVNSELTITISDDYLITSIAITLTSNSEVAIDKITVTVGETKLDATTNGVYTINASSVKLTNGNDKQYRIASITISYVPVATCEHANATKTEASDADCENAGNTEYWYCADCEKYFSDADCTKATTLEDVTLAALGHKFEGENAHVTAVPASCEAEGKIEHYVCDNCSGTFTKSGETYTKVTKVTVDALGHKFEGENAHVTAVPANCEDAGTIEHYVCDNCSGTFTKSGETYTKVTNVTAAALGHKFEGEGAHVAEDPATCEGTGTAEHYVCDTCHGLFDKDKKPTTEEALVLAALGHKFEGEGAHVAEEPATCEDDGTAEHYVCDTCHGLFDKDKKPTTEEALVISAIGHNYGAWAPVEGQRKHTHVCANDATHVQTVDCTVETKWSTDNDNHWHECSVCHAHYDQATHNYGTTQVCECGKNIYAVNATYGDQTQAFATLKEAFAWAAEHHSAETPVTITLKNDLQGDGIDVSVANVVLDLGGHTYTVNGNLVGDVPTNALRFLKGTTVTIQNGTIATVADDTHFIIQNYANLTLDGVTLDGAGLTAGTADNRYYVLSNNCGTITIKNNSKLLATGQNVAVDVWYGMFEDYDAGVSVSISGDSTVQGFVEYGAASRITGTEWTAKASLVLPASFSGEVLFTSTISCEQANITIGTAHIAHACDAQSGQCARCSYVSPAAQLTVGETTTNYQTLAEAAAALPTDGTEATIKLLHNTSGDGIVIASGTKVTFNLNGFTYTVIKNTVGSVGTKTNGFQLLKGATVTFQNGTINTVAAANAKILIQNYANLTFDNVILDGSAVVQGTAAIPNYVSSNNFGTITYKNGSKVIATGNNVAFDVWYGLLPDGSYDDGLSVTVESGCTVEGTIEYGAQSRITGTDWTAKASLVLPEGTYNIRFASAQEGLSCDTANITIGGEAYNCAYGTWSHVEGTETHSKTCTRCGNVATANCAGGTASCKQKATCSDCGAQYGTLANHTFGDWADEVPATCTSTGTAAHKDCTVCGKNFNAEGTELASLTLEINSEAHSYGDYVSNGDGTHSKVCQHNAEHKTTPENCHGGTATCTQKAECSDCGAQYGTLANHTYDKEVATETYLASAATCTAKATYFKSCVCGEKGTETFQSGSALGHSYVENVCSREGCSASLTEAEVLDLLFALGKGKSLEGTYKLTGTISKVVDAFNSQYNNITFDMTVGEKTVQAYRLACTQEVANTLFVGAQVTVTGELTRYYDTYEFKENCTASNITLPTYAVSSTIENGTITGLAATYTCGETATFTVSANTGYKVQSVKVYGTALQAAADGSYSFVVTGNANVVVTIVDESTVADEVFATLTFPADQQDKCNNYTDTWNATIGTNTWKLFGLNNSNNGWSEIRTGRNNATVTATIAASFAAKVTKVSVNITTYDTSKGTATIKLHVYSSSAEDKTLVETINGTLAVGVVEFAISEDKVARNLYYVIEIDCASGTSNGFVRLNKVEYYAEACAHDWGDGEVTKAATCKEAGERTFTCSKCSNTKTEEIAKLTTHSLGDGIDEVPAKCETTGTVAHTDCTVCGKHFDNSGNEISDDDLVISALGHEFVDGTCTREGCGATESTTPVQKTATYTFGSTMDSNPNAISNATDITARLSSGTDIISSASLTQCYWKSGTALKFGSNKNVGKLVLELGTNKATKIVLSVAKNAATGITVNGTANTETLTTSFVDYEWTLSNVSEITIQSVGSSKYTLYIESITIYYA